MRVVVGLGNPGHRYRNTRHNTGFIVLDGIATGELLSGVTVERGHSRMTKRMFSAKSPFHATSGPFASVEAEYFGTRFLMVKPSTYMNESGKAVSWLVRHGKIRELSDLLVVVDDVNLDIGRIRFREKGSAGGQKGLKHIIQVLGSNEFSRLRIGVGPKPAGSDLSDHVLGTLKPAEKEPFEESIRDASEVIGAWIEGGCESAQREVSRICSMKSQRK